MKRIAAVALALACAGTASAHAQNAAQACADIGAAMKLDQAALIASRAGPHDEDDNSVTYKSSIKVSGLNACTLSSDRKRNTYGQHTLKCEGEAGDEAQSIAYVEGVYACLKEGFSVRETGENRRDGRWRVTKFTGEWTAGAPDHEASFGDDDYSSTSLESSFGGSEELSLYIWYYFLD